MSTVANRFSLVTGLPLVLTWCLAASQNVHGGEFRFVVEDLPDNSAVWVPSEVVIHTGTDLKGGLAFILVNPTARTHVFLVEGLYEQTVNEHGGVGAKPLRVTIAPEEIVRTGLSTTPFQELGEGQDAEFHFFCPLHRGDADPGGTIRIVHRGGTIRLVP